MKALVAIASKTIRSAVRSRTVHVLLFFSAITVFILPMTLAHDGTAKGLVQISVTYTLGITGILLSLCAVWLGATLTAEDIEGYQIHMVVTKPVGRIQVLLGKWLGVVTLLGGLLVINVLAIFGMCHLRLYRSNFEKAELDRLRAEVMIGRRSHQPSSIDFNTWAEQELERRLKMGMKLPPQVGKNMALDTIKTQLTQSSESIDFNMVRPWVFKGLPTNLHDETVYLQYRIFVERAKKKNQRSTEGIWFIYNPKSERLQESEIPVPVRVMGGATRLLRLSTDFISPEGELRLTYLSLDPEKKPVVVQESDGPLLLLGSVSFLNNYSRVCLLLFLQIMFMATLGCATGAGLSTPMAVFVSFSYLFFGLLVRYIRVAQGDVPRATQQNVLFMIFQKIGDGVQACTFSLNEYVQIGSLTQGQLVELSALLASAAAMIFFRAIPIFIIGLIGFYRRELGLVIRK